MLKAVAVLSGNVGVKGTVHFTQEGDGPTTVSGNLTGLKPGLHGFHVHALGDTTNSCMSTGPHFNPAVVLLKTRFVMLVILEMLLLVMMIPLAGPSSIVGRAVVVHADPDDLGRGAEKIIKWALGYQLMHYPQNSANSKVVLSKERNDMSSRVKKGKSVKYMPKPSSQLTSWRIFEKLLIEELV